MPATAMTNDPLQFTLPLPIEAEYYPMGFPLRIATNYERVLIPASLMWARFPKLFDHPPVRLRIAVSGSGRRAYPVEAPVLRGQEHLISIVANHANFATADLNAGFGHVCVTREIALDPAYLRYHFLEPLAYVLLAARHIAFVHASAVALNGQAVLLCGASGVGKTCLAYACARRGWTFLSGDAVAIAAGGEDHRIVGRPFEIRFRQTAVRLFPELVKFPQMLRPSGKTDIEVDPRVLGVETLTDCTANRLVFLKRVEQLAATSLRRIGPVDARRELESGILFGDTSVRERQRRALDRLAQVPAYRLRYSDLDAAESALRGLIQFPGLIQ